MKNIQLISSVIDHLQFRVDDGPPRLVVQGWIQDDQGGKTHHVLVMRWDDIPTQIKAQLNNIMREMSKEFNQDAVNEDSETWTDLQ